MFAAKFTALLVCLTRPARKLLLVALPLCAAAAAIQPAQAASIASLSPQGEVAQVRQIAVAFSEAVVAFGDLRLADPMAVACEGAAPAGGGRWTDDRHWVYDFRAPLPPGLRCSVTLRPEWKPSSAVAVAGSAATLTGTTSFSFSTGGPAVTRVEPWPGSQIEEDQHFLLHLGGPAVEASVAANAWCEVEGIGERIPLRIVAGAEREAVIRARHLEKQSANVLLLACQRPLPPEAKLRLVWGPGIAAQLNRKVLTTAPQRFDFQVRQVFSAEFSCERERANAPCMPILPVRLRFSAPVARAQAQAVRLKPASGAALAPAFDKDDKAEEVSEVRFPTPLTENAPYSIELPPGLKDNSGRPLANAASFPLKFATGDAPPIAKFAAAPFGVIESADPVLPLTLRHVQGDLRPAAAGGQVRVKRLDSPAEILAWYARVRRFHESQVSAREAGLPQSEWYEPAPGGKQRNERYLRTREVSLLKSEAGAKRLDLPALQGGDPRPFEVVGIPLAERGYHVVEIESSRLGASLLDKKAPMYVRTGVLVTNLGLHFRHGRENSLVWVTTLDRAAPVAGAEVAVHDCHGNPLWNGTTDATGLAKIARPLESDDLDCRADLGLFVTARLAGKAGDARNPPDIAFVFSSWQQGIEPWRFNLPTAIEPEAGLRVHTVFDRTLLRAGETVSMKHFARLETLQGLATLPPEAMPTELKIVHEGSGQEFTLPLAWSGSRSATSSWVVPPAAKLGLYRTVPMRPKELVARNGQRYFPGAWASGDFRVEEFRLPLVDARIVPPKGVQVAPKEVALAVQMNYLSGGPMAGAPLRATAMLRPRGAGFAGYEEFSFEPPRAAGTDSQVEEEPDEPDRPAQREGRLVADKQPLATDKAGAARLLLGSLPKIERASELLTEVTFNDPNGEVQTVSQTLPLWPSAVVLGVKTGSWASQRGQVAFSVLALDTGGRPLKGQAVTVQGRLAQVVGTRKRIVGGFYAYDNRTETRDLGSLCSGTTDDRGLLLCDAKLDTAGQVELVAKATDAAGNPATAAASVWVTRQGELWFAQSNDDRIDVLPEKKRYEPGETARLQVRMPFREATALVSIERSGVVETRVQRLRGDDPTIEIKIDPAWAPNVYVSVLAVRGRIRDVRWYSFFDWGWREPLNWARSFWYEGREYQVPTAMVDLSKPAFKIGVAALQVGTAAHELQVKVTTDRPQYTIRQTAIAHIQVRHGGKPAAGAEVAFAAVDESLLALRPNDSWDLLAAMIRPRAWGVETATAQGEIIGRRHYGRKAVAAGGGGGRGGTRELFDTLLLWRANVVLDAQGQATVEVPLNDALTSFRLVAVADAGPQQFGSGSATIRVSQDLQVLSGLPPLVREGDRYTALLTLRNTTAREMKLRATLGGSVSAAAAPASASASAPAAALSLPPQDVVLAAGSAREVSWTVEVPTDAGRIVWEAAAVEQGGGGAKDRLKVTQTVVPAVPVRVLQATLSQLDGKFSLPVAAPADALPAQGTKRGGLNLALQAKLSGALPGLRRYFETYPYSCLEQKTSIAIGLKDAARWAALVNALPTYLDSDGLANYYPTQAGDAARGSDTLTAYLLAASFDAGYELPPAARDAMLGGLTAFVEGRIERRFWVPTSATGTDLDVRKLAAIAALARHGRAQPKMLGSVNLAPNRWPTSALIDWLHIVQRLDGLPDRAKRLDEVQQILRARLSFAGTTLRFSTEESDFWWWRMDSGDANAARLILAVLDDPAWRDELPRMVAGHLGRQQRGAWLTTTANLWSVLALDKFSAKFESVPVAGRTTANVGGGGGAAGGSATGPAQALDWSRTPEGGPLSLPWPAAPGTLVVAQEGSGKPWLTVQSLAAVPLKAPLRAGYSLTRSVTAVERRDPARWSRGDVLRVRLEVEAQSDMSWVVVSDPVPGGATILGSGLGRDSALATRGERREGEGYWMAPAYEERGFESFRSNFEFLPRGRHVIEYSLRLNNPGRFALPPSRAEAMYAPETFGEWPNEALEVAP